MEDNLKYGKLFFKLALISLTVGLLGGALSALTYLYPGFLRDSFEGLVRLRPFHVSFVMFWIILAAVGGVYSGLATLSKTQPLKGVFKAQFALIVLSMLGIAITYAMGIFGGREYWKFNPIWALPILISWILFLVNFIHMAGKVKKWPVYLWMWMTGITYFLFIFIENYLWIFPYFRTHFVTDYTIQWKVNGSIVGAINQLSYGVAFYLMDRIKGIKDHSIGRSNLAFSIYFLGLFNMLFNWGHHIYWVPTLEYIRYIGYTVSMTEWILFVRIIYLWRKDLEEIRKHYSYFPYRFIMASNFWVFVNLGIACLMSIPVLNMYVHGTFVIVGHSMGTTIGINTMILFAGLFMFMYRNPNPDKYIKGAFWMVQISLMSLFLALNIAGMIKGFWQMDADKGPFLLMMAELKSYFRVFVISGIVLMCSFFFLIYRIFKAQRKPSKDHQFSAISEKELMEA